MRFKWLVVKLARLTRSLSHERGTLSTRLGTRHVLSHVVFLSQMLRTSESGWVLRSIPFSTFHQGSLIISHVFYCFIYYICILQRSTARYGYPYPIIYHQPLPFAHDRHVQTCLSCHQRALTHKAYCDFRALAETMPVDC